MVRMKRHGARRVVRPLVINAPTPVAQPMADWTGGTWNMLGTAAIGAAAYHGYKRNHSAGWAVFWAVCAAISPVITVAVALTEGFGKRKGS